MGNRPIWTKPQGLNCVRLSPLRRTAQQEMVPHDAGDNKPLPLSDPDTDSAKSTSITFFPENALHLQVNTKANLASSALSSDNNKDDNNTHNSSSNNNNNSHPQLRSPTCASIPECALPAACAAPAVLAHSTLPTRTRPLRPSPHRCTIALAMQIPVGRWVSGSPGWRRKHSRNAERQRQQLARRQQGGRSIPRLATRASPSLHMGQLGIPAAGIMLRASRAHRSTRTARRSHLADGPGER